MTHPALKPCRCGGEAMSGGIAYINRVWCRRCGAMTAVWPTQAQADAAWDRMMTEESATDQIRADREEWDKRTEPESEARALLRQVADRLDGRGPHLRATAIGIRDVLEGKR